MTLYSEYTRALRFFFLKKMRVLAHQGEHAHSYGAMATKFGLALTIDIFSAVVAYPLDTVCVCVCVYI